MLKTILINRQLVNTEFTILAYRVYSVLSRYNRPISLSSLASKLHEPESSVKRAISELQKKGLWLVKFQVLTNILVKDSIYNLTDNTLNNILSCKKGDIHPTGKNSARALWHAKVHIKEYLVSLLTKDMNKLRYWCKVAGHTVSSSMDKKTLVDMLHDKYLVRFVKYHITKMGSALLNISEKELVNIFNWWLHPYVKGRRPNPFKVKQELKEELVRLSQEEKYDPQEEIEANQAFYAEFLKIDWKGVPNRLEAYRTAAG